MVNTSALLLRAHSIFRYHSLLTVYFFLTEDASQIGTAKHKIVIAGNALLWAGPWRYGVVKNQCALSVGDKVGGAALYAVVGAFYSEAVWDAFSAGSSINFTTTYIEFISR